MTALSLGEDLDRAWEDRMHRRVVHHAQQELF